MHPHESPKVMTVPMIVLAVGSVAAGFLLVEAFPLSDWMTPVFGEPSEGEHVIAPLTFGLAITVVALLGVALAWLFVGRREVPVDRSGARLAGHRAARHALYADAVNESLFMRPGQWLTRALVFFDNRGVDGAVNGMAAALGGSSSRLGRAADRLRAHVRPRHARRRRDRRGSPPGGDDGMSTSQTSLGKAGLR